MIINGGGKGHSQQSLVVTLLLMSMRLGSMEVDTMLERYVAYYGLTTLFDNLFQKAHNTQDCFQNLTRIALSDNNIRLAIKLMSENSGRNTPGVDLVTFDGYVSSLKESLILKDVRNVLTGRSKPEMVRRVFIPKSNGKLRPLGIQIIRDRIAQQAILNVLIPITEAKFSQNSMGFRRNISTKHAFVKLVHTMLASSLNRWVLDIDFKSFFDEIPLDFAIRNLREDFLITETRFHQMIRRLMCIDTLLPDGSVVEFDGHGLPQGSILGPLLSNVFLHKLDMELDEIEKDFTNNPTSKNIARYVRNNSWDRLRGETISISYKRYADDIRILTYTESECLTLKRIVERWSRENLVTLSEEKTKYYSFDQCNRIEFVGFAISKRPKGWVFSPINQGEIRKNIRSSFRHFLRKGNPSPFIALITSLIYHYNICTNLNWMCNDSLRYAHLAARFPRGWIGKVEKMAEDQNIYELTSRCFRDVLILDPFRLRKDSSVSIREYFDVPYFRGYSNPTERVDCTEYLEACLENEHNSRCLMYLPGLLHMQKFRDPVTKEFIIPSGFDIHHKVPLSLGGKDNFANLVALTKEVHKKVHYEPNCSDFKNNKVFQSLTKRLEKTKQS